jgi:nucleoside-diphosphate-sugar epimerase
MKRILITGGAGFIGYHLTKRLAQQGHKVIIVDDLFKGRHDSHIDALIKKFGVEIIKVDLTDKNSWNKIGTGYDYVYHLAGINGTKLFYEIPQEVLRIGIETTVNALEWFRSKNNKPNAKILYTSSNEAYAGGESLGTLPIPTPENVPLIISDPYNPRWSYAGQKLIGELLFINYAKAYNFRQVIVRPHNFYGPRAGQGHAIPELSNRIEGREDPFTIFGSDETRSFCYIDDAVEAMQMIIESDKTDNGTYHIGTNIETKIKDLVEEMFSINNWRPKKIELKKSPEGSVKRRLPDVSKVKNDTGWVAETSLNKGLSETIKWYAENKI